MRKHAMTFVAALFSIGVATSASAAAISTPAGLGAAIKEASITESVYWGWGGYYAPVYVAPPVYVVRPVVVAPPIYAPVFWRPRYYARPYFWGGPRFYGRRFYGW